MDEAVTGVVPPLLKAPVISQFRLRASPSHCGVRHTRAYTGSLARLRPIPQLAIYRFEWSIQGGPVRISFIAKRRPAKYESYEATKRRSKP